MGQLDGMETARRLRQIEESLRWCLSQAIQSMSLRDTRWGLLGYLLKPVREDQLKEVLSRAAAALLRRGRGGLSLPPQRCDLSNSPEEDSIFYIGPAAGLSASTSGIWFGQELWTGWRAARWSLRDGRRLPVSQVLPALGPAGLYPGGAGGMRMRDVLWQIWLNCGYFLTVAASGFSSTSSVPLCPPPGMGASGGCSLFLTLAGSTGMVIWIGDPNLLYTPAFFALFLLLYPG